MKFLGLSLFLVLLLAVAGCDADNDYQQISGRTMGTGYTLTFLPGNKPVDNLSEAVESRLQQLNQNLSTYIEDSDLNQLNRSNAEKCIKVSRDTAQVMSEAMRIFQLSDGAFDPGLGPLIELWGFDKKDTQNEIPAPATIKSEVNNLSFGHSKLDKDKPCIQKGSDELYINFSAIAKGYGVDVIARLLERDYGIENYLVEIGGEVKVKGKNARNQLWRIAIEAPQIDSRRVQKVISPGIMAVATSGDYRNYFEKDGKRYSHTIDPTTGYPIDHSLASVTVLHPSAMTADALATVIMVLGDERGRAFANRNNIAVFMIIKSGDGFEEYYNAEFTPYLDTNRN